MGVAAWAQGRRLRPDRAPFREGKGRFRIGQGGGRSRATPVLFPRRCGRRILRLHLCAISFDYWLKNHEGAIGRAFGIWQPSRSVGLEAKPCSTDLRGTPPTVDLLLAGKTGEAWAIEPKFTEPFAASLSGCIRA